MQTVNILQYLEILLIVGALLFLAFYHLFLLRKIARRPETTAYGRNRKTRQRWVDYYHGLGHDVFVVQALRNWIMASNFLAGTGMFITLGLLGFTMASDNLSTLSLELNLIGNTTEKVLLWKILLLCFVFFATFFSFSLASRSFIHSGFLINLPREKEKMEDTLRATRELERGAILYFMGLRFFYIGIPLALWIFGPIWMFLGTIVLILILFRID